MRISFTPLDFTIPIRYSLFAAFFARGRNDLADLSI